MLATLDSNGDKVASTIYISIDLEIDENHFRTNEVTEGIVNYNLFPLIKIGKGPKWRHGVFELEIITVTAQQLQVAFPGLSSNEKAIYIYKRNPVVSKSNALVSSDMGPQADHREKKDWGVCPDIDSLFCAPLISSVDDDWINNNHYLLPGVHVGHSNGKWVRGFEVSYFKSILVGGFGFVFTVDEISYKERFGLGFEAFFTYFGLDINAKSDTFGSLNDFNLQIRPMLSIGWISAYYALGDNHQYGLIFKLPVKLNK